MPRTPPPIARLAPLVAELSLLLRRNTDVPEILRATGAKGGRHVGVLVSLAAQGPATIGDLATRLHMAQPHASAIVADLDREGLVERAPDPADRRRRIVQITKKVEPALDMMRRQRAEPLRQFLAGLTPEQADTFIDQLAQLVETLRTTAHDRRA
jgi:DNA-binding MarR family transcriptional regulator